MTKHTVKLLVILMVLVNSCKQKEDKEKPDKSKQVVQIEAMICQTKDFQNNINVVGILTANEEIELRNEINGRLTDILFKEGSEVKKGELLIKINDKELQAQLKQLNLEYEQLKREFERQEKLLEIKAISIEEYEISKNKIDIVKAKKEYVESQIEKTEIKAAFNGIIGLREVSEGAYLNQYTRIGTLLMNNPIKVEFNIPEKYAMYIKKGNKIYFKTEFNNEVYEAEIYAYETKIDQQTRTFKAKAICDNDGTLRAGAFVKVQIPLENLFNTIMVPTNVVISGLNVNNICLIKNGNITQIVNVTTGVRTDSLIQIISGLKKGDTIASTGLMQIKNNMTVEITKLQNNK